MLNILVADLTLLLKGQIDKTSMSIYEFLEYFDSTELDLTFASFLLSLKAPLKKEKKVTAKPYKI